MKRNCLTSRIRIVAIYKLLLETDSEHPVTLSDIKSYLADEWGIEKACYDSIANDIEALKVIDIRVQSKSGRETKSRYYSHNKYWMDK